MNNDSTRAYAIPAPYRRMENMHIIFWLLKDISWCMLWKPIGIAMIFPTLIIAIVISYRTRQIKSELAHNLAVVFWITANSYWMVSEFLGFDEKIIAGYEGKYFAVIPFLTGILILLYYYLIQRRGEVKEKKKVIM
jgi:hypothetical protein